MKILQKQSQRWLKKKAWIVFSAYIRKRDNYICFTCGARNEKGSNAGHFRHGHTKAGFYNETNVNCQCQRCNLFLSGNLAEYGLRLANKVGLDTLTKLKKEWDKDHNWTRKELISLINKYNV
jgi:hypothetical protein